MFTLFFSMIIFFISFKIKVNSYLLCTMVLYCIMKMSKKGNLINEFMTNCLTC